MNQISGTGTPTIALMGNFGSRGISIKKASMLLLCYVKVLVASLL